MYIDLLNHACVKISFNNGIKILCDPWFDGYCFEEGWGLKYDNPSAWEKIKDCNYLWLSHFHTDHYHAPTLKKILQINPGIIPLANLSYNFKFTKILSDMGFTDVIPFIERKKLYIFKDLWLMRYPTTGIDNMLFIQSKEGSILNYNDCNIPISARKKLKKYMGNIDILLNNFNHAGKLMDYPQRTNDEIKAELISNFIKTVKSFKPAYTIPFASFHYYRAPESVGQNNSLMNISELINLDNSIIPLKIGEKVSFNNCLDYEIIESNPVFLNKQDLKIRDKKYTIDELKKVSKLFCNKINNGFFFFTLWIPSLIIQIIDLNKTISLNIFNSEITEIKKSKRYHISVQSQELWAWWANPYGTDSFWIGGHFEIGSIKISQLNIIILFGLLSDNRLDIKSLCKMFFSREGFLFLVNRKEEIISILQSGKFLFGIRK